MQLGELAGLKPAKRMREVFGDAILDLCRNNEKVVVLDGDLASQVCGPFGIQPSLARQMEWAVSSMGLDWAVARSSSIDGRDADPSTLVIQPAERSQTDKPALVSRLQSSVDAIHVLTDPLCGDFPLTVRGMVDWLRTAISVQDGHGGGAWEAEPDGEPCTIHELAARLLGPYQVRDGNVRLAGCTLDELAHLRIGRALPSGEVQYQYFGPDGSLLESDEVERFGFEHLHKVPSLLRRSDHPGIEKWTVAASDAESRLAETRVERDTSGAEAANCTMVDLTVIWSRRASGKIVIQFDAGASVPLAFDGWARDFFTGRQKAPKFRCPATHLESYSLVMLEDGTVTVAEAVSRCEVSGAELLISSMDTCQLSGKRVDKQLLATCAITGKRAIADQLMSCDWCGEQVVPSVISKGRCDRCRHLRTIASHDFRLGPLFESNRDIQARFGRGRWTGWIDANLGVLVGSRMGQKEMIVFRAHDGHVIRRGSKAWPLGQWQLTDA